MDAQFSRVTLPSIPELSWERAPSRGAGLTLVGTSSRGRFVLTLNEERGTTFVAKGIAKPFSAVPRGTGDRE
jgi:hypothetical protein